MPKCRFCNNNNPAGIDRCQNCGSWLEQTVVPASSSQALRSGSDQPASEPSDFEAQVISLVRQNQKIAAIKLYREMTGTGLAEAKAAVEALASGQSVERRGPEVDGSLESRILALMHGQRKIEAIKLYRQQTGVGLKEAKDAVESLALQHGISPKGAGCAGVILLMIVAFTVSVGFARTLVHSESGEPWGYRNESRIEQFHPEGNARCPFHGRPLW